MFQLHMILHIDIEIANYKHQVGALISCCKIITCFNVNNVFLSILDFHDKSEMVM